MSFAPAAEPWRQRLASLARQRPIEIVLGAACRDGAGPELLALVDQLRLADVATTAHLISAEGRIRAAHDPADCGRMLAPARRAQCTCCTGWPARLPRRTSAA